MAVTMVLLSADIATAQQGWIPATSGTANNLYAVSFPDTMTAYAVGFGGIILKSTDAGSTWKKQSSGTTQSLDGVSFADALTGIAVGAGGTILRTTDGGATWVAQTSGTTADLTSVALDGPDDGMAVGGGGTILQTADGGTTWARDSTGSTSGLNGVSFVDSQIWVAVGSAAYSAGSWGPTPVLRTTDAGATWSITNLSQSGKEIILRGVSFSSGHGIAAGTAVGETNEGETYYTTADSGTTWHEHLANAFSTFYGCSEAGPSAVAVGNEGIIYRDGVTQVDNSISATLYGVAFADNNRGVVVGNGGIVIRTTDAGVSTPYAPELTQPANGSAGAPVNERLSCVDTCWCTGFRAQVSTDSAFANIVFDSTKANNAIGKQYFIVTNLKESTKYYWRFNTNNNYGPGSWSHVWTFTTQGNPDLAVFDSTLDSPWSDASYGSSVSYTDTNAISVKAGAWGALSLLDGSWGAQDSVDPSGYSSLNFSFIGDREFGVYLQTDSGQALQCVDTTLSGSEWVDVSIPVRELDPADRGVSRLTFQSDQASAYQFYVRDIRFVGLGQSSKTSRRLTPIADVGTEVPKSFELSQNYPNPFNPTTTITYRLSADTRATLTVYDVLGRVVATPVNAEQPAGRYEITFDGSRLASGVYLYRLDAGSHVFLRKMLLVK